MQLHNEFLFVMYLILFLTFNRTSLSYDKSFVAIETVLGHIEEHIPSLSPVMRQILNSVVQQRVSSQVFENYNKMYCTILCGFLYTHTVNLDMCICCTTGVLLVGKASYKTGSKLQ